MTVQIIQGDSREKLLDLATDSIDSVVTDPPYALVSIVKRFGAEGAAPAKGDVYARASAGFMGKQWDTGETAFDPAFWAEVLRVLKPGGHVVAFGGTRTYHRLVCAIEDGGFEIRDQLAWIFGSGFPKSHDVSKGIDKAAGAEREVVGEIPDRWTGAGGVLNFATDRAQETVKLRGVPATAEAAKWQGWGTALKPAQEPICLARKPLIGTVAGNVLKHGTGALNIDACRVEAGDSYTENAVTQGINTAQTSYAPAVARRTFEPSQSGRWPANVIHDGSPEVLAGFPETTSGTFNGNRNADKFRNAYGNFKGTPEREDAFEGSTGSAARFFYTPKSDKADRCFSKHPTVKPVDLMAYLIKLVTPPGGLVLDPFAGSGSTGMAAMREGFNAILIEREAEYVADIQRRLDHVHGHDTPLFAEISA